MRLEELDLVLETNVSLQFALDSYHGQISNHYPKPNSKPSPFNLEFFKFQIMPKEIQSRRLLDALTIFTDGSGKSDKSVFT